MSAIQNDPIYTLPNLNKQGMIISNDATTPHTVLDISAGQCRDSQDTIDIVLGNPNIEGQVIPAPLLLNAAVNGANGLDTGTFAEATMYAIYMIADSRYYQPTACIATLASNSVPLLPFGYDSYRLIGYWATQTSEPYWAVGYYSGAGSSLMFTYDAPVATSVTAGAATSYTGVVLTALVPPVANTPVSIAYSFLPGNAAGDALYLQGYNSTGDAVKITGQVTTVHVTGNATVLAQLNTAAPTISYKVTSASSSEAAALNVAGFGISL